MIAHPCYPIEPWGLREIDLDLSVLAQSESLFALANGHIGWRGNLDEGEPHGAPGCYLNGVYELRALPYAEAGFGYPESGQTVVNTVNGKLIRLLVDDEPFDIRYGTLRSHERFLDFRTGLLHRRVEWCSPADRTIRVTSTRLVSLVQRSIAAIEYSVEVLDGSARVVAQSELLANEPLPSGGADPRVATTLNMPWRSRFHGAEEARGELVHRTNLSGLTVACAMGHAIDGPDDVAVESESFDDLARTTMSCVLRPGEVLRFVKFVSYGWSSERSDQALQAQVDAALAAALQTGWDGLIADQRRYLDDFWGCADVQVEGDEEIQQAVRFGLFHVLQATARAERRAIPAKGLTGTGYDGHAFWDSETFVLQLLTHTAPDTVAHALRWRHDTLAMAKVRAYELGLGGAVFAWRTINGAECSSYWPAGTAAFHVNADIADAAIRYVDASGDIEFERDVALELLVETARMWRSLGHHDTDGGFRIDGVTGPDEYSAVADNNVYTNLMAQRNLRAAAAASARHPARARELGVDVEEMATWRDAASAMVVCFDESLGVHSQSEGFTTHERWDFDNTAAGQYPLLLHFPYFDLYRKQVVKQADLVLAMHLCGTAFTPAQKLANFDYYEALTVRDSSLSACTQAVVAAEVGHLDLAARYLSEAALMDLDDVEHNTADGLHMASLAGTWIALVAGFGGMRLCDGELQFDPRLPDGLAGLSFGVVHRGSHLRVALRSDTVAYTLRAGAALEIVHRGERLRIDSDEAVYRPIVAVNQPPRAPDPPRWRAPKRPERTTR